MPPLNLMLNPSQRASLLPVAAKVFWWGTPEDALRDGYRFAAQAINPMITLKALTYFADGNLHTLTQPQREKLVLAASQITDIPPIARISDAIHA